MFGAFAMILREGEILMIKRGIEPHLGYWCPQGGVRDEGESLDETAVREVKEETGLDVEVLEELGRVIGPITGNPLTVFLCTPRGGRLRPAPPETTEVRWIPYEELSRLQVPRFMVEFLATLDLEKMEQRASRQSPREI